jgi:hypothetical protein
MVGVPATRRSQISNVYGTSPHLIYGNDGQPLNAQMSQLQNTAGNGIYGLASQGGQNEGRSNAFLDKMLNGEFQNQQPNNPYLGTNSSYGGSSPSSTRWLTRRTRTSPTNYNRGTAAQTDALRCAPRCLWRLCL